MDGVSRLGYAVSDDGFSIHERIPHPVLISPPDTDDKDACLFPEKEGEVPNVVFPCGAILLGEDIFLYYGGADRVVGVAAIKVRELFKNLV